MRNARRTRLSLALAAAVTALSPPSAGIANSRSTHPYLSWFPKGQCTYWAYEKRPDIVNTGVARDHFRHWNAWEWAPHARAEGYSVTGRPRRGDIAVWAPNVAGADSLGHVAYVKKVVSSGTITVSEMNWNGDQNVSVRQIPRSGYERLSFIHRR